MSSPVVERLRVMRQKLEETPANPWSNIATWSSGATAFIREFWPQHHPAFLEVVRAPRWLQLPRVGRIGQSFDTPGNRAASQSEAATNKRIAEEAKARILSFLDELLEIATLRENQPSQTNTMNQNSTEQNLLAVMHAMNELADEPGAYVEDSKMADQLGLPVEDVADYMDILEQRKLTSAANTFGGHQARLTANGRMMLRDADFRPNLSSTSTTPTGVTIEQERAELEAGASASTSSPTFPIMDIFISHATADENIARALAELLRAAFNVAPDRIRCTSVNGYRLDAGDNVSERLRVEVFQSRVFIGLITPKSVASSFVLFELGARWGAGKPLLPLLAAGAGASALPGPLSAFHAVRCQSDEEVLQFVENVGQKLEQTPNGVPSYLARVRDLVQASEQGKEEKTLN